MPSIHENNTASALLATIAPDDGVSLEQLALASGIGTEALRRCRDEKMPLPPLVQVKVARAIAQRVPRLTTKARRLENQAQAALRMELGTTAVHLTAPPRWW